MQNSNSPIITDIKFSSDFIIGYPGETENDFNDTLKLLDKVNFINSFSFIFSPRPGTTASNYELIDNEICKERLIIIQKKLFNNQIQINKSMENQSVEVLVENKLKILKTTPKNSHPKPIRPQRPSPILILQNNLYKQLQIKQTRMPRLLRPQRYHRLRQLNQTLQPQKPTIRHNTIQIQLTYHRFLNFI